MKNKTTIVQDEVLKFVNKTLKTDLEKLTKGEPVSLAAKWMPSLNTSSSSTRKIAKKICSGLNLHYKEYRKMLSSLRNKINIVESNLCEKNYDNINYENVPSKASLLYRKAFLKNDKERYSSYLEKVKSGDAKINSGTLYPHEIINALSYGENNESLELQWKSLPNYAEGVIRNVLPVIDVSGSMGSAISKNISAKDVAVALGLYFSERINGKFKNNFITFHEFPELLKIEGNTLFQKVQNIKSSPWGGSTNLQSVFDLILNTAKQYELEQSELPTEVIIISDMEFNCCCHKRTTNLQLIKDKYKRAGYTVPKLVFWNVMCRNKQTPATMNDDNVKLVSGFSPSILKSILSSKETNPFEFMLEVLNSERYEGITI